MFIYLLVLIAYNKYIRMYVLYNILGRLKGGEYSMGVRVCVPACLYVC